MQISPDGHPPSGSRAHSSGQRDRWMDGQRDRWMDGQWDRWMDGQRDRWMDGHEVTRRFSVCTQTVFEHATRSVKAK
jgi:hypothetical protein